MRDVTINVGPSRCFVEYGKLDPSYRYQVEYELKQFCRKDLSHFKYDFRSKRYQLAAEYWIRDAVKQILYIPGPFRKSLQERLTRSGYNVILNNLETEEPKRMVFRNNPKFKVRPKQEGAIDFLVNHKNTRRGLELQTGCLIGSTVVNFNRASKGFQITMEMAYKKFNGIPSIGRYWDKGIETFVRSFDGEKIRLHNVEDIVYSGEKEVFELVLENGLSITGTANHKIMTDGGFVELSKCVGLEVMCDQLTPEKVGRKPKLRDRMINVSGNHPYARPYQKPWKSFRVTEHILIYEACVNGFKDVETFKDALVGGNIEGFEFVDTSKYVVHHKDHDHHNNEPSNLEKMLRSEHAKLHNHDAGKYFNQGVPKYSKVVSITPKGVQKTYDICCAKPHHNFVANGMVVHNSGKTFCSIRSAYLIGKVTMVVVDGMLDQWEGALKEQTYIPDKDVFIIQGFPSLKKLFKLEHKPKFIIASLATMRNYVKYGGDYRTLPRYDEFVKIFGIGTKIVDEAHKCLHANALIDMAGDIQTNIYLTATFLTSDRALRRIFNTYFTSQMRYEGDYDRYCEIFGISYRGFISSKKTIRYGQYSHARLEKLMLWSKTTVLNVYLERYLIPCIDRFYLKKEKPGKKKCLIFFALKQTIREVRKYLQKKYPQLNVVTFVEDDPEENLEHGDIIISTHKGCGTGRDIKDLVTVINTISYAAETLAVQTLGRLRKLACGITPTYVDLYDMANHIHIKHWKIRSGYFRQRAKEFREFEL